MHATSPRSSRRSAETELGGFDSLGRMGVDLPCAGTTPSSPQTDLPRAPPRRAAPPETQGRLRPRPRSRLPGRARITPPRRTMVLRTKRVPPSQQMGIVSGWVTVATHSRPSATRRRVRRLLPPGAAAPPSARPSPFEVYAHSVGKACRRMPQPPTGAQADRTRRGAAPPFRADRTHVGGRLARQVQALLIRSRQAPVAQ